jgi:hypothetical protein
MPSNHALYYAHGHRLIARRDRYVQCVISHQRAGADSCSRGMHKLRCRLHPATCIQHQRRNLTTPPSSMAAPCTLLWQTTEAIMGAAAAPARRRGRRRRVCATAWRAACAGPGPAHAAVPCGRGGGVWGGGGAAPSAGGAGVLACCVSLACRSTTSRSIPVVLAWQMDLMDSTPGPGLLVLHKHALWHVLLPVASGEACPCAACNVGHPEPHR